MEVDLRNTLKKHASIRHQSDLFKGKNTQRYSCLRTIQLDCTG